MVSMAESTPALAGIGAITEAIKIKPKNPAAIRVLKLLIFEKICMRYSLSAYWLFF